MYPRHRRSKLEKTSYFRIQVARGGISNIYQRRRREGWSRKTSAIELRWFYSALFHPGIAPWPNQFYFPDCRYIRASNGSSLASSLAGTPGLTSLRFLSRQFPNSVPGDPWFIALLPVIPYCRWFTTEFRLRPATSSSFSSAASSAAIVRRRRRRRRVLFFSLLVLACTRSSSEGASRPSCIASSSRKVLFFLLLRGKRSAELWFEVNKVLGSRIARKSACADLCPDNCDFRMIIRLGIICDNLNAKFVPYNPS